MAERSSSRRFPPDVTLCWHASRHEWTKPVVRPRACGRTGRVVAVRCAGRLLRAVIGHGRSGGGGARGRSGRLRTSALRGRGLRSTAHLRRRTGVRAAAGPELRRVRVRRRSRLRRGPGLRRGSGVRPGPGLTAAGRVQVRLRRGARLRRGPGPGCRARRLGVGRRRRHPRRPVHRRRPDRRGPADRAARPQRGVGGGFLRLRRALAWSAGSSTSSPGSRRWPRASSSTRGGRPRTAGRRRA